MAQGTTCCQDLVRWVLAHGRPGTGPSTASSRSPQTPIAGWLEAFAAHPRLGDAKGVQTAAGKFGELSRDEQAAAASAGEDTLQALRAWNAKYEARFGHIFIACASGTPAERMLEMVQQRCAWEGGCGLLEKGRGMVGVGMLMPGDGRPRLSEAWS